MAHVAIDWNKYMNGLAGKANIALDNVSANVDFVVESRVNTDGSWYRKYKSGWLEQGGNIIGQTKTTSYIINLLKPYINNKYTITLGGIGQTTDGTWEGGIDKTSITTTSFKYIGIAQATIDSNGCCWYACGPGADFANEGILEPEPGLDDILG